MTHRWLFRALAFSLLATPVAAQGGASTTMLPGKYTVEARDSAKAFPPIPFELKKNGTWVMTLADGNGTFSGTLKIKDDTATYSDQGCVDDKGEQRPGTYMVRSQHGAFWLEVQSDSCEGRGKALAVWLYRPMKK
jgi:hypothetical protein